MQQGSLKFYFCRMLTCNCITKAAKMKGDNKKMPNQNFRNKKYPQLLFTVLYLYFTDFKVSSTCSRYFSLLMRYA